MNLPQSERRFLFAVIRLFLVFSRAATPVLLLIIDQGEEVFTLAQTPDDQQRGRRALDMLRRTVSGSGYFKVIFCLRTEYYGRVIDRLRRGLHDTGRIREYLLTDFDEQDLIEAIRRPTADEAIAYTSEVPFDKYGFHYAEGVAEEIAYRVIRYTTQRRDSVLPLVQVICAQLYGLACQRDGGTITTDDLEKLGGIEGGMRNHVEGLLGELLKARPLDKRPVQKLFTQLYLKQPDGTLTTALLAEDEVAKRWTGRMPFDQLLHSFCAMRLLKVNTLRIGMEEERRYVSLGHDALAKIAADWDEELSRGARMRKMAMLIGAVSSVAVVMAVLAVFAFLAKDEAIRAQEKAVESEAKAEENLKAARRAVNTFFTNVSEGELKHQPGGSALREKLLQEAKTFYDEFALENAEDPEVRAGVALANFNLGRITEGPGKFELAIKNYERALQIQEELAASVPEDEARLSELGDSYHALGRALKDSGRKDASKKNYQEALRVRERLAKENPENTQYARKLAESQMGMGLLHRMDDHKAERHWYQLAEQTRREQVARIETKLAQMKPDDKKDDLTDALLTIQFDRAKGFFNLTEIEELLLEKAKAEESPDEDAIQKHARDAFAAVDKAVSLNEYVRNKRPNNLELQKNLAMSYIRKGTLRFFLKPQEEGLRFMEQAERPLNDLVLWEPKNAHYQVVLAWYYNERGLLQKQSKNYEDARTSFEKTIAILSKFPKNDEYAAYLTKEADRELSEIDELSPPDVDRTPGEANGNEADRTETPLNNHAASADDEL